MVLALDLFEEFEEEEFEFVEELLMLNQSNCTYLDQIVLHFYIASKPYFTMKLFNINFVSNWNYDSLIVTMYIDSKMQVEFYFES